MIKLGLSACFFYPDPSRTVFGHKSLTYMENDMATWLTRRSVLPILIPTVADELIDMYLEEVDALVLQGGSDVSPESYNEKAIENGRWSGDRTRDLYELKLIEKAIAKNMPILGICRGFQLLNVHFGGTLYQDIGTQLKTDISHRCADKYDTIMHEVHLNEDSILKEIYKGKNELLVNTVHHQCVKTLGANLIIDARSPTDDILEAFHHKDITNNLILAVQWHPEFSPTLGDKICDPNPLLDYFLEYVEKNK